MYQVEPCMKSVRIPSFSGPHFLSIFSTSLFFIKKESLSQVFPCEFCEISKDTFLIEHLGTTAKIIKRLS